MSKKSREQVLPVSGAKLPAGKGEGRTAAASRQDAPASVQAVESEDTSLKGHREQEQKKLLKQNVTDRRQSEEQIDTPAGQHATGSKTGK